MGLSRNKVAVPEGAAGTPPFWSSPRYPWGRLLVLEKPDNLESLDYLEKLEHLVKLEYLESLEHLENLEYLEHL